MKPFTIAICGGIGCGKTVVARMVAAMGYEVYDTDSRAKSLMDSSDEIKSRIACEISPEAIAEGGLIDRAHLAAIVFNDTEALARLNTIVHTAVREDFERWRAESKSQIVFLESAILFESGFDNLADAVWEIIAPRRLRIERITTRNAISTAQAEARITAQETTAVAHRHPYLTTIVNDGTEPMLPIVTNLLQRFKKL